MTQQGQSNLSGRKSLADGLVHFVLGFVYYHCYNINGSLHVIDQLIQTQKINFYLFRFFTLIEPPLICLVL